ncbi:V-type ATPase 116kDa subunit family protein [Theileria parva strain Muguga]|uniref:V-type proton ATPase subunit a n=1 Tax=Theileria parva TaxID=5875 RepID=Q4N1K4_THEPA|nr:V-type ATPase 116kDa subunit family protein [Theileria parva strain Muguga]EAN32084.1 V-type ATPase 116kDa subunit family protein [Theileria parva strain Muguga]|eukprot:XP_764367.1 vacuolar ATP synthase subunit A [Theileria parva strain Muguga]
MGIFRSETMVHGTLVIPHERARNCIDLLSRHTNIQYIDMNERRMDRPYKKYVQRIDHMERMIRVLYEEIAKLPNSKIVRHNIDNFLEHDNMYRLDQVEESLVKLYDQFQMFKENDSLLRRERDEALSEYYVLLVASKQLNLLTPEKSYSDIPNTISLPVTNLDESSDSREHLLNDNTQSDTEMINLSPYDSTARVTSSISFTNISGLISSQEKEAFSRAIFRAMRGNVFTLLHDTNDLRSMVLSKGLVDQEELDTDNDKTVFVIYCQSSNNDATYNKIKKLCTGFQAKLFNWCKTQSELAPRLKTLEDVIKDKKRALEAYKDYFRGEIACLLEVIRPGGNSVIEEWFLFCKKEKYLYYILNHFEGSDITLRADCWFPADEEEKIREHLLAEKASGSVSALLLVDIQAPFVSVHPSHPGSHENLSHIPPTYNKTNMISKSFQNVVDTYGIPRYKEVNPAPFTVMTFPFLFGLMFGDIAHGICVILFALFLILYYRKLKRKFTGDIANMILEGRYMILLMGIMATYTGFIYNDFLSIPNSFFGTGWISNGTPPEGGSESDGTYVETLVRSAKNFPVVFGLDPAWIGAVNEQSVLHSFKMKFSVIFGFFQMTLGILLKGFNAIYFSSAIDFFFEFMPQLAMMCSFVGYMNFLIFHKWLTPLDNGYAKPSIITTLIDMCLMKTLEQHEIMYEGQQTVQRVLMSILIVSVPLMLIPKPLILYFRLKKQGRTRANNNSTRDYEMVYCGPEEEDLEAIARESVPNYPHRRSSLDLGLDKFKKVDAKNKDNQFSVTIQKDENEASPAEQPHSLKLSELFIHQFIETIEFTLGTISNTASYLRLWALSLSHQQLSLVLFKQLIFNCLDNSTSLLVMIFGLFIRSIFFSIFTFFIMLCMDSLECYLHALRLQWVEFQNKFFKADGRFFRPFNIKLLLDDPTIMEPK